MTGWQGRCVEHRWRLPENYWEAEWGRRQGIIERLCEMVYEATAPEYRDRLQLIYPNPLSGQWMPVVASVWQAPPPPAPPWAEGEMPDTHKYVSSELFVAGALSTMAPFASYHPAWCLPFARQALEALGQWEPDL